MTSAGHAANFIDCKGPATLKLLLKINLATFLTANRQNHVPIRGLSPTRPTLLPVMPPVDVAAAIRPLLSIATAPTVSCPIVKELILKYLLLSPNFQHFIKCQILTGC